MGDFSLTGLGPGYMAQHLSEGTRKDVSTLLACQLAQTCLRTVVDFNA